MHIRKDFTCSTVTHWSHEQLRPLTLPDSADPISYPQTDGAMHPIMKLFKVKNLRHVGRIVIELKFILFKASNN